MSTIPGVTSTTTVISNSPRGNAVAVGAFVGAADSGTTFIPYSFSTYTEATSALGTTTANGQLINMISQAFLNGANSVVAVVAAATGAASSLAIQQALAVLLLQDGIDYVVIENTDASSIANLKSHLQSCVVENRFRRGYSGLTAGSTVAQYVAQATTTAYDRQFLVGPNFLNNAGVAVAGGVSAATAAAIVEGFSDPALPRTRSLAQGVSGIETLLLVSDYNSLHNAGVMTTFSKNGDTGIMRFLTTYVGTANIKEGTIALERDYVANNLTSRLEMEFKHSKNVSNTRKQVEASILGKLKEWQEKEIVNPDKAISATAVVDPNDPSKVNVSVSYWAVYPLNFISLTISLNI